MSSSISDEFPGVSVLCALHPDDFCDLHQVFVFVHHVGGLSTLRLPASIRSAIPKPLGPNDHLFYNQCALSTAT